MIKIRIAMAKQCERNKARINVNLVALKLNSEARSTGRQSEQRAQLSFQYLAIYINEKLSNIKTMGSKIVQYQNYGLKIQIKTSKNSQRLLQFYESGEI